MPREIFINVAPFETRVAVVERQRLAEIFLERQSERGVTGNIYKARVTRVLPGMQAAFVDIGLDQAAYLHVSDLEPAHDGAAGNEVSGSETGVAESRSVPIEDRLRKGNELLVQVSKEPVGGKGARVTAAMAIPGRHLVFQPAATEIGISRRIEDPLERSRLREIVAAEHCGPGGFIVRTAAAGRTKRELQADIQLLMRLWERIRARAEKGGVPQLLHADEDVVQRTVRDLVSADTQRVVIDDRAEFERSREFLAGVMPGLEGRVELWEGPTPLFDDAGIETQILRALDRKVWLRSGGHLILDSTEALTVIDVNTGRFVGKKSEQETVLRTNLEAVKVIAEQLRLRNIGGLIVIDLIDMESEADRRQVYDALRGRLRKDRQPTRVLPMSEFGLIEMSRRRSRESLAQALGATCGGCEGTGFVVSTATLAFSLLRRLQGQAAANPGIGRFVATAVPEMVAFLRQAPERWLDQVAKAQGVEIELREDASLPRDRPTLLGIERAPAKRPAPPTRTGTS